MKRFFAFFLAVGSLAAADPDLAPLARAAGGTTGVTAIHVETGRRFGLNEDQRFPMASVCKFPLAIEILHRVEEGKESLDRTIRLAPQDLRLGVNSPATRVGKVYSVRQLLEASLQQSDNTSTDVLFRELGGPKAVAARMRALEIAGIDLSRSELEMSADYFGFKLPSQVTLARLRQLYRSVPPAEARRARQRFEADPRDTATPAALAALLVKVQKREALGPETTAALLDMMHGCKTGDRRLRALLPPGTPVADKTGTVGGTVNDVGLVTLPGNGGHLAVAVLVKNTPTPAAAEGAIAAIAKTLFDASFDRAGPKPGPAHTHPPVK